MKKLFTILCAGLLTLGVSAQTDAGTVLLQGSTDLNFTSMSLSSYSVDGEDVELTDDYKEDSKVSKFGLGVVGGYFLMDGLAAGLLVNYSSSTEGEWTSSSMTFGPMVRYYIGESGLWGQLSYGMGSSKEEYDGDSSDGPKTSTLAFGAGYAIYLADNISFNPSLAYTMLTMTEESGDIEEKATMGGIVFSAGLTLHLGN